MIQIPEIGSLFTMKSLAFFKSLSWLLLLNLLVKPVWVFGIDRQVQNVVGHEAYGTYFSILNLSIVLSFLADAGLTNLFNRQLALGASYQLRGLVSLKLSLSLLYLGVLSLTAWLSGIRSWDFVLLTGTLQVLNSFFIFYRNVITGYQLFSKDAWLSIIDKSLMIVVGGLFLYTPLLNHFSINAFLGLQIASFGVALMVAWVITFRNTDAGERTTVNWRLLIAGAMPFIVLLLLMGVHSRLDAFLLERIHPNGAYETGVYASAYRLLDAGNMLGFLAASFLVPFVAHRLADLPTIQHTVLRLRHALLLIGVVTVAVTAVFAQPIVRLLYHTTDAYHPKVLTWCVAALPAYYLIHIYGSLLTAKGLLRSFIQIVLASVFLNIILNLLLIPDYGAWGCCLAALVSQYACGGLCFVMATRAFGLRPGWLSIGGYILAGSLIAAGGYALRHFILT